MSGRAADDAGGAGTHTSSELSGESRLRATIDALLDPHVVFAAVRDEAGAIVDFRYTDVNAAACAYNRLSRRDLIGARLLQRLPGVRQSGLFAAYCRVVETGEPLVLDGVTYESDLLGGVQPYYDIRGARLGDGISVTWRDITDRHRAMEALRSQRDLAVALSGSTDLAEALELIAEAALALDGVESAGVYLVDPETGELDLVVHAGLSQAFADAVSHYAADAPNTREVKAGVSIFGSIPQMAKQLDVRRETAEGLRAFAAVPMRHDGMIAAVLNLASRTRDEFSGPENALIETLAAQAGAVVARLRREVSLRDELERLRAREAGQPS